MIRNNKYLYGPRDVSVPAHLNFGEMMLKKFWENEDRIALINGATHEITKYGQLAQEVTNLAVSLTRLGVRKGEVVAIMSENRYEYFSIFVAVACAGAVVTTINQMYTEGEINHILSISKPDYLFCTTTAYQSQEKKIKSYKQFKKIFFIDDANISDALQYKDLATADESSSTNTESRSTNKERRLANRESRLANKESSFKNDVKLYKNYLYKNYKFEEINPVEVNGKTDTLVILYSSGTTGLPKGVMLTHHNIITMCACEPLDFSDGINLTIGPWFHAMGLVGSLTGFYRGKSLAFLPKFDVENIFKTVERYKVEMLVVVPAVAVAICKSTAKFDFSSVKKVLVAAAPMHRDTELEFMKKYPNVTSIIQGYGMTECCLGIAKNRFHDRRAQELGSPGKAMDQVIIKIVNPDTREPLGPNQDGEICVKGDVLMKGYVDRDPREYLDEEGFFMTGDVGHYNDEGYLVVVDRLKELIKYKANQVAPAELEALLLQHHAVRECGVVGLLDREAGELPLAYVALQPGRSATEREIQQFVAERVSNPKHLRGGVRFLEEIPKNATGKIQRMVLRRMANNPQSKL